MRRRGRKPRKRFVVRTVTGYTINPASSSAAGGGRHRPTSSFSVLDSAYCYRIIREFNTGSDSWGGEKANARRARELCNRLNAWDRETKEAAA
jgi:hypothetical protein